MYLEGLDITEGIFAMQVSVCGMPTLKLFTKVFSLDEGWQGDEGLGLIMKEL